MTPGRTHTAVGTGKRRCGSFLHWEAAWVPATLNPHLHDAHREGQGPRPQSCHGGPSTTTAWGLPRQPHQALGPAGHAPSTPAPRAMPVHFSPKGLLAAATNTGWGSHVALRGGPRNPHASKRFPCSQRGPTAHTGPRVPCPPARLPRASRHLEAGRTRDSVLVIRPLGGSFSANRSRAEVSASGLSSGCAGCSPGAGVL